VHGPHEDISACSRHLTAPPPSVVSSCPCGQGRGYGHVGGEMPSNASYGTCQAPKTHFESKRNVALTPGDFLEGETRRSCAPGPRASKARTSSPKILPRAGAGVQHIPDTLTSRRLAQLLATFQLQPSDCPCTRWTRAHGPLRRRGRRRSSGVVFESKTRAPETLVGRRGRRNPSRMPH